MKRLLLTCLVSSLSLNSFAADESVASDIVKQYSQTIACQLVDNEDYQKNQYKAVRIRSGFEETGGMGEIFVVYWEGDVGCSGGNGTVSANFTVVEQSGFSSVPPVVKTDYKFPQMELVRLTEMTGGDDRLLIKGVAYGPEDRQHRPSKEVTYVLELEGYEFTAHAF